MEVGPDGATENSQAGDEWGMRRYVGMEVEIIYAELAGARDPQDFGGVGVRRTPSRATARWEQIYHRKSDGC